MQLGVGTPLTARCTSRLLLRLQVLFMPMICMCFARSGFERMAGRIPMRVGFRPYSVTPLITTRHRTLSTAPHATDVVPSIAFRQQDPAELAVPDVALTRSRDGTTGTATFRFDSATVLERDDIWENGLVTGMWLRDSEGEMVTPDVSITWVQGQPKGIMAILVLKNEKEWQRFMRFMERFCVYFKKQAKSSCVFFGAKAFLEGNHGLTERSNYVFHTRGATKHLHAKNSKLSCRHESCRRRCIQIERDTLQTRAEWDSRQTIACMQWVLCPSCVWQARARELSAHVISRSAEDDICPLRRRRSKLHSLSLRQH